MPVVLIKWYPIPRVQCAHTTIKIKKRLPREKKRRGGRCCGGLRVGWPEAKGAHHGFAHCFFMRY